MQYAARSFALLTLLASQAALSQTASNSPPPANPPSAPPPAPPPTPTPTQPPPLTPPEQPKPEDKPEEKPAQPEEKKPEPKLNAGVIGALPLRSLGPAIFSGRITDLAVNPARTSEFYVGVACGNVWKTTNGGVTFSPIFDGHGSYSIGCVVLDPNNSNVVWVGTGENNSQRSVGWGDGVYVSRDAGKSFTKVGLKQSEHIGRIMIDPRDSNVVYVAAQGPLWKSGGERGLYKTVDGGATWERVLHVSDDTGINEVHCDPRNPDVLYASAYQRRRHVWTLIDGGPESTVYKSIDAGKTWRKIEKGLPGGDKGRIGMAVSPANPDIVYAIVEAAEGGGIYRSTDRGESWDKRSGYMSSSPQYYNELIADPVNPDRFYAVDTVMHVTDDGGATMRGLPLPDTHVDSHALWIDPNNTDHLLKGCDGGLYESFDRANWRHFQNLPIMQFYRVAVDTSTPFYYVYGGTQDNASIGGPSRTADRAGITNEDWFVVVGGDGFEPAIDPDDPDIVYGQWQHAGLVRFDRKSGEELDIKPREKAGEAPFVWNWDSPLIVSPHHGKRLYFGSRVIHRSDDRGDTWTTISPDLTRGTDRNQLKVMGVIQKPDAVAKHMSTSIYGNCVSLSESPLTEGLLFVGTDDGLIQVTEDGGTNWRKIDSVPGVPEMTYVSDVEAGRHSSHRVFACFDAHKNGDFTPYVFRSDDRGLTWASIAGDLPAGHVAYAISEDHVNPDLLFLATEFGAFVTLDGGAHWFKLGGAPTIAMRDVEIQRRESDLVLASFGRGFYVLDDYSPLRTLSEELLDKPAAIFGPGRPVLSYVERARVGGGDGRGPLGGAHYNAKNPPFGAVFTFYLKEKVQSRKETRKEAEKKDDWQYPTLEQFQAEDREQDPEVNLLIRDSSGLLVRRLGVSRDAGMHRAAWNLRMPPSTPVGSGGGDDSPVGTLVPPGTYSAQLVKVVDGVETTLADAAAFEVRDANFSPRAASGEARDDKYEFERRLASLQRAVEGAVRAADEAQRRVGQLREGAEKTPGLNGDVLAQIEALRTRLNDVQIALRGDPTYDRRVVPELPSIRGRVSEAIGALYGSTQPPTVTQREQYAIACDEFEKTLATLRGLYEKDLKELEARLEAAGTPWTPGRLPDWRR
ncbi:hypothetical protein PHYC_03218 [Phycisphaerales bacterium]|nr:hypothetical protein PHYC_03218 [Phycisphaerales bacterium]